MRAIRLVLPEGSIVNARPPASVAAGNVEALIACAKVLVSVGELVSALDSIKEAQSVAPGRPDLFQLQAQVAVRLGDLEAGVVASLTNVRFSVVSGGVACVIGALGIAKWSKEFMDYEYRPADVADESAQA